LRQRWSASRAFSRLKVDFFMDIFQIKYSNMSWVQNLISASALMSQVQY
jgi:hypothetical protein